MFKGKQWKWLLSLSYVNFRPLIYKKLCDSNATALFAVNIYQIIGLVYQNKFTEFKSLFDDNIIAKKLVLCIFPLEINIKGSQSLKKNFFFLVVSSFYTL